jgi:hypothetical protein
MRRRSLALDWATNDSIRELARLFEMTHSAVVRFAVATLHERVRSTQEAAPRRIGELHDQAQHFTVAAR